MHAIDDLLIDAALSQLSDAQTSGAYSSLYLEKQAVRHLFGARALAHAERVTAR